MRAVVVLAAAVLLLTGCGQYTWHKPEVSAQQADRDREECSRQARLEMAGYDVLRAPPPYWTQARREPGWQLVEERRVLTRCMEAKGYRLTQPE